MDVTSLTIKQAHEGLKSKKFTVTELTQAYLNKINKHNEKFNIYLTVSDEIALQQASTADKTLATGKQVAPLFGIPASIKDIFNTKGIRTTASSRILESYVAPYESTTTARLYDQGMVILGKTNCDAFAFGASTENSGYGPTKNPWDIKKVPGGSSGGAAASVAAQLAPYALGTDTGGSIRQPAALCGNVGLKLTYGRASRYGIIAMASSFDTPGPIARTVEDAAIIAEAIAGYDPLDGTTVQLPVPKYSQSLQNGIAGKKIAVLLESFDEGVEEGVKISIQEAVKVLQKLGADITEVSMPKLRYSLSVYYILVPSEISSNMARFDSVRYGHRSSSARNILELQMKSRGESMEDEVKRRIMLGNYALSSGYYDAYYLKAAKVRTIITHEFNEAFKKYDAIVCPTSPTVAFDIGSKANDPLAMYLADIFTCPVNVAGVPGLSVPCGFANGLPVGLQIIGRAFDEETILQIGYAYEQATDWHNQYPNII